MRRCTTCGCELTFMAGDWWDHAGFKANALNGKPWHVHEPADVDARTSTDDDVVDAEIMCQHSGHCTHDCPLTGGSCPLPEITNTDLADALEQAASELDHTDAGWRYERFMEAARRLREVSL